MRSSLLLFPLLAPTAAMAAADARPIAEAERAFAAMAKEKGIGAAFRTFAAEQAIMFVPDPKLARAHIEAAREGPGSLSWFPVYAGIARSGDLGFTTGPFVSEHGGRQGNGWFFTIWQRQPDGTWRWLLDHGTPTRDAAGLAADAPLASLPPGRAGVRGAAGDLAALEARLDRDLAKDAPAALASVLAEDGRVMRVGPQPAVGRADFSVALLRGPATIEASRLGGAVSDAGDLAYSYGLARWSASGKAFDGHYVRVWQRRSAGWKLIVDELVPKPPLPAAAPAGGTD